MILAFYNLCQVVTLKFRAQRKARLDVHVIKFFTCQIIQILHLKFDLFLHVLSKGKIVKKSALVQAMAWHLTHKPLTEPKVIKRSWCDIILWCHEATTSWQQIYSLPEATMVTTMDVEVEELCTRTVAKMPIMRPETGFCRRLLEEKASPVEQNQHISNLAYLH